MFTKASEGRYGAAILGLQNNIRFVYASSIVERNETCRVLKDMQQYIETKTLLYFNLVYTVKTGFLDLT